jgi:hypothetical protein
VLQYLALVGPAYALWKAFTLASPVGRACKTIELGAKKLDSYFTKKDLETARRLEALGINDALQEEIGATELKYFELRPENLPGQEELAGNYLLFDNEIASLDASLARDRMERGIGDEGQGVQCLLNLAGLDKSRAGWLFQGMETVPAEHWQELSRRRLSCQELVKALKAT